MRALALALVFSRTLGQLPEPTTPPPPQPPLEQVVEPQQAPPAPGPLDWEHPWVLLKGGIGVPAYVNLNVEVFLTQNVTLEAGAGMGLGVIYNLGARWRPDATCWGCRGRNLFSFGFGPTLFLATLGTWVPQELFTSVGVDALYVHRFLPHFGLLVGLKTGIGPSFSWGGRALGIQFGLEVVLSAGLSF